MKIIHVDDHPLFSESIGSFLRLHNPDVTVRPLSSGRAALELLDEEQDIDLIFMDLDMPNINGFSVLEAIKKRKLSIPIVVVSGSEDLWDIRDAMEAGAVAFVPKTSHPKVFLEVLKLVVEEGGTYVPDDIEVAMSRLPKRKPSDPVDQLLAEYNISNKQYEVLKMMNKGLEPKDIAKMLYVSPNTIKSHTSALYAALGVKNRLECVMRAQSIGLLLK